MKRRVSPVLSELRAILVKNIAGFLSTEHKVWKDGQTRILLKSNYDETATGKNV